MRFSSKERTRARPASVIPTADLTKINVAERASNVHGWLRRMNLEAFVTCGGKATAPLRGAPRGELQQEMQLTSTAPRVPPA